MKELKRYENCTVHFVRDVTCIIETVDDESIPVFFAKHSKIKAKWVCEQASTPGVYYISLGGAGISYIQEADFEIEKP